MSPVESVDWISNLSPLGMVALALLALLKGWVVTARELKERDETIVRLLAERNEWQQIAMRAVTLGERTVKVAENGK